MTLIAPTSQLYVLCTVNKITLYMYIDIKYMYITDLECPQPLSMKSEDKRLKATSTTHNFLHAKEHAYRTPQKNLVNVAPIPWEVVL